MPSRATACATASRSRSPSKLRRVHCDDGETLWRISRVDVLEPRQRVAAIRATEGPELYQHRPAPERGEREGRGIEPVPGIESRQLRGSWRDGGRLRYGRVQ